MSAEHTPTPWTWYWRESVEHEADCGITSETRPGHAYAVARCPRYQTKEKWASDAAFIVRAVNAHDDLIAALAALAQLVDAQPWGSTWPGRPHAQMDAARAALAKAAQS